MPVVDASVWVALFHVSDPGHHRCVGWLRSALAINDRLFAPTLLVTEVAGAIRRLTGQPSFASRAVDQLFELGAITLVGLDHGRARRAAGLAAETGLRAADAVYLGLAQELGERLVTADRQQADRASGIVQVHLP